MTVQELADKLKAFDIVGEARAVISKTSREYVDRNKKQMLKGESREQGLLIGSYRSPMYRDMKLQLNPEAKGNVDLKLTGQFHAGLFAELEGDNIMMTSRDKKAGGLEEKYGDRIYGLNDENQTDYNSTVFLPEFLAVIEQKTGLSAN